MNEITSASDLERVAKAKKVFADLAALLVSDACDLSAVLVVTDGEKLDMVPLRVSARDVFSMLVSACCFMETVIGDVRPDRSLN